MARQTDSRTDRQTFGVSHLEIGKQNVDLTFYLFVVVVVDFSPFFFSLVKYCNFVSLYGWLRKMAKMRINQM